MQTDQQTIDIRVWKPFAKRSLDADVETFIQLHSKDVIRVGARQQTSFHDQYKAAMEKKLAGLETVWLAMDWRTRSSSGFERIFKRRTDIRGGIFQKWNCEMQKGEKQLSFGQFHVALRKRNDYINWKILVTRIQTIIGRLQKLCFWSRPKPME